MTIKDIAAAAGLSHQAIYKRLKARGVKLEDIKIKGTGELTAEGEALIKEIFSLQDKQEESAPPPPAAEEKAAPVEVESEVEKLRNQVAELSGEVEKLRNQVATLEDREKALTDERDFLRLSLERSQQLQAITAQKIPNPPPALPAGGDQQQRRGLFGWIRRGRERAENGRTSD